MYAGAKLCSKKLEFIQDKDTLQDGYNDQILLVEINDGGAGPYVIISTERWAFDIKDIDEFCNMLKEQVKNVGF
jgi:hypothetical protein